MTAVLNFSPEEIAHIKEVFAEAKKLPTHTEYEAARWRAGGSTVTLYTSGKVVIQGNDFEAVKKRLLNALSLDEERVLGIDEVGRSEDHGPLVIAGVLADKNKMRELRDSKKTRDHSSKARVAKKESLAHGLFSFSPAFIDDMRKKGVNLNQLQLRAMDAFYRVLHGEDTSIHVRADGKRLKGARRDIAFTIGGDDKDPVMGAASVIAKHERETSPNKEKRKTWKKKLEN